MNGFVVTIALAVSTFFVEQGPSNWYFSYADALADARVTRRPLLVVFYEPDNPVQQLESLESTVDLKNRGAAVHNVLLSKYTLCRVDVSTTYGRRVASAFRIKTFPFTAITDRLAKKIVYRQEEEFSEESWVYTLAAYQHGERSTSGARPHAAKVNKSYSPISSPTFSSPPTSSPKSAPYMCPT